MSNNYAASSGENASNLISAVEGSATKKKVAIKTTASESKIKTYAILRLIVPFFHNKVMRLTFDICDKFNGA